MVEARAFLAPSELAGQFHQHECLDHGSRCSVGLTEPGGAELVQVGRASLTARARIQPQRALGDDDDPAWAKDLVETVAAGMAGPVFAARVNPGCRTCPVASCCPVNDSGTQVQP